MSGNKEFAEAIKLIGAGKRKEAVAILLVLYQKTSDDYLKLSVIDALLNSMDPIYDNSKLIEIIDESIKIANKLQELSYKAYFMGRKAEVLRHKNIKWEYQRKNLKLAPGWFGFSTLSDKEQFEKLTKNIENNNREIEKLISKALLLAERSGNPTVVAYVLTSKGSVASGQYFDLQMKCIIENPQVVRWFRFQLIRRLILKYAWLLGKENRSNLRKTMASIIVDYLRAANIYEKMNDIKAGYAYYNLANHLRSTYSFRKAKKYLKKAEYIANSFDELRLQMQIKILEKSIKAKNKDVPNYLNGEEREELT